LLFLTSTGDFLESTRGTSFEVTQKNLNPKNHRIEWHVGNPRKIFDL